MFKIATRNDVLLRAFKMASIVGIVLAIINHGDHILLGTMTYNNWIKIRLANGQIGYIQLIDVKIL